MGRVQVVLGTLPPLLRDIVAAGISGARDIDIAAEASTENEVREAVRSTRPDAVILAEPPGAASLLLWNLFREHPDLRVFILTETATSLSRYQLRLSLTETRDVSTNDLIDALRATSRLADRPVIRER